MAMTEYDYYYGFHEATLKDKMQLVTNNTARTLLHNELVYLDGFFGEVCEIDGIAAGAQGYINFNSERLIRTSQVADDLTVVAGATLYFILQGADAAGSLTHSDTGNTAIGIVTAVDGDGDWVEFRPFVQPVGLLKFSAEDARVDDLEEAITLLNDDDTEEGSVANSVKTLAEAADFTSDGDLVATAIGAGLNEAGAAIALLNDVDTEAGSVANSVKTLAESADFTSDGDISAATIGAALNEVGADVASLKTLQPLVKEVVIGEDASGGLDFSLATLGMGVGDRIINMWVLGTAASAGATMTVSHGNGGAAISGAMSCVADGDFAHSGSIVGGVLTADGLTVTANGAADRASIFIMYLKA